MPARASTIWNACLQWFESPTAYELGPERRARWNRLLGKGPGALARTAYDPGHLTVSAWVLCDRSHLLLVRHRKLQRWLQPGGHVEPADDSLLQAALREVREETGLEGLNALSSVPFDVDEHEIPPSRQEPAHWHFDVRFAFEWAGGLARAEACLKAAPDEVTAARWVELSGLREVTSEDSVLVSAARLSALAALSSPFAE